MATYYVATNGNDANAGTTTGAPKATIAGAVAVAVAASDKIQLRVGDYPFFSSNFAGSEHPRNLLTIENYPGEAVTISRAHGGTFATNAGTVCDCRGWTNCEWRSNPAGGRLKVRHTGTPVAQSNGYLAVGNSAVQAGRAGIRFSTATGASSSFGNKVTDVDVEHIFGFGVWGQPCADLTVLRSVISDCACGVYSNSARLTVQDSEIADCGYMLRDGSPEEDTGANGIQLDGATDWTIVNTWIHGCWSRTGSEQFGAEGGPIEFYNVPDGGGGKVLGCLFSDNHNFIETGTDLAAGSGGGPKAEIAYNVITGRNDYQTVTAGTTQAAGGLSGSGSPNGSTSFLLFRALRDTWVHHNTWDVDNGAPSNAGFRTTTGGSFAGVHSGNILEDNIVYGRFATPIFNFNADGSAGWAGWTIRNNLIRYVASRADSPVSFSGDYTGNVFASTGTTNDYPLSTAAGGGASIPAAALGLCVGDKWGDINTNAAPSDPKFIDAGNAADDLRDYRVLAGSAAIGMASDGGTVGAYAFDVLFQDDFGRVGSTFGTADVGGLWTPGALPGTATLTTDGLAGIGTLTAANQSLRASLLSVSVQDVELWFEFEADKVPVGGSTQHEWHVGARASASVVDNDGYLAHIIVTTALVVRANFLRRTSTASQVAVTTAADVAGVPAFAANTRWAGRVLIVGSAPTRLLLRVWRKADAEPSTWAIDVTDSAGPQGAGAATARFTNTTGLTNAPVALKLDALLGKAGVAPPPVGGGPVGRTVADGLTLAQIGTRRFVGARPIAQSLAIAEAPTRRVVLKRFPAQNR